MLLVVILFSLSSSYAQTNAPAPSGRSNRYLLIVQTSRSMQHRSNGVLTSAQDLFSSRMGGQLRNGDTIGIWTYNEELSAGKLPVQQWSEDTQQSVTSRILSFLKAQKYEKQARIEKVLPPLGHLIKSSAVITVILISDGTEEIHGTAFDDKINGVFQLWRSQQRDARMPFVTVLRGVRGNLTDCAVNLAPWKVELPPLPPEPQVAKAAPKPSVVAPKPAPSTAPMLPPLIISGRKTASAGQKSAESNAAPAPVTTGDVARQQPSASVPAPPVQTALASPLQATAAPASAPPDISQPAATPGKSGIAQALSEPPPRTVARNETNDTPAATLASDSATQSGQDPALATAPNSRVEVSSAPTTGAQIAAATPRGSGSTLTLVAVALLFGIIIVVCLVWFWRSRPKSAQPESLITQSLDRHRK